MFFSDPIAAFTNLRTVLRPGGRLAFVCWARLEDNPLFAVPLEVGVRHLGPPEPRSPRAPGPLALSEPTYVEEILDGAGFAEIAVEAVATTLPCTATTAEEAGFATTLGPVASLIRLREPDETTLAALVDDVAITLEPYQTEQGVQLPASVFYVVARCT